MWRGWVWLVSAWCGGLLAEAAMGGNVEVVGACPANGAADVDPALAKIVITFSVPMKADSWSVVTLTGENCPPAAGPPRFVDDRTFEQPVRLQAGTAYAVSFNSGARRGFVSAGPAPQAATPYVLRFRTAGAPAATTGGPAAIPPAAGGVKSSPVGVLDALGLPTGAGRLTSPAASPSGGPRPGLPARVVFQRVVEPREQAFSLLVPRGWRVEGGITRVSPDAAGGAAQSIEAKLDFALKQDATGKVLIHWLPEIKFCDVRGTPVGNTGMFPPGSTYNGMPVQPLPSAADFLAKMLFPFIHPQAANARVAAQQALPELAQRHQRAADALVPQLRMSYDAATVTVTYTEGGVEFQEALATVIENMGPLAAGMWSNKETFRLRAPVAEFAALGPIFGVVQGSVRLNPKWVAGELAGQIQRGAIARQTQEEIQRLEREIVAHRQQTNAEINKGVFLNLTGQEEFVNPFTNEVETGTNQWAHRWLDASGNTVYSNDANYDPNRDGELNQTGFKRAAGRAPGQ